MSSLKSFSDLIKVSSLSSCCSHVRNMSCIIFICATLIKSQLKMKQNAFFWAHVLVCKVCLLTVVLSCGKGTLRWATPSVKGSSWPMTPYRFGAGWEVISSHLQRDYVQCDLCVCVLLSLLGTELTAASWPLGQSKVWSHWPDIWAFVSSFYFQTNVARHSKSKSH